MSKNESAPVKWRASLEGKDQSRARINVPVETIVMMMIEVHTTGVVSVNHKGRDDGVRTERVDR
jgi:hypothetical protein